MPDIDIRECGFKKWCAFQLPVTGKHNLCSGPTFDDQKYSRQACALAYPIEPWDIDYLTSDIHGGRAQGK